MDWLSPIIGLFGFDTAVTGLAIVRAIFGFIFVFFVPGFAWAFVFFKGINVIERVALSLGLSIAIVTLSLFLLNWLIGIRITTLNSVLVIIVVTILPLVVYYLNRIIRRKKE